MTALRTVIDDRGVATVVIDHPPINLITMEVFFELAAEIDGAGPAAGQGANVGIIPDRHQTAVKDGDSRGTRSHRVLGLDIPVKQN